MRTEARAMWCCPQDLQRDLSGFSKSGMYPQDKYLPQRQTTF